jgi:CoA:oxalate CoA-transferase
VIPVEPPQGDDAREFGSFGGKADLPYSPINNMKEICEDPLIAHRGMLAEVDQPVAGKMRIAHSPIRLSKTPGQVREPAPLLGQHTKEILREMLEFSGEQIDRLRQEGVVDFPKG